MIQGNTLSLPKGWEIKRLGEVCEIKSGTTISPSLERNEGDVLYTKIADMNLPENQIEINTSSRFVKSNEININQIIAIGAIIFPKRGGAIATNKKRKIIKPTIVDLNTMAIIPGKKINNDYFYFWFQLIDLNDISNGTSIPQINNYSFDEIYIPFPESLHEQQCIVATLNQAFEYIAIAKNNAEQNLNNAKELFESYLQGVFVSRHDGWEEKRVEELCKNVTVGFVGKMADKYKETGIPFLRSQNIKPHQIDLKDVIFIDQDFNSEIKKSQLSPGDLAIVRTGYPGTAAVIPKSLPVSNCSDIVIVNVGHKIDPYFLCYFFNSAFGKKLVLGNIVGAAQKHFNIGAAKKVKIPFPTLPEQQTIVAKLDALSAETKRLEAIYQQKIADLEDLKKSLLQKAFNGELKTIQP